MMDIGKRINEFDNKYSTVGEFNKLFPQAKLKMENSLELEILEIPLNKPFYRVLKVNGKKFEHNLFPPKGRAEYVYKTRKPKKTFTYKLYKNDKLYKTEYEVKSVAPYFGYHDQHLTRLLRNNGCVVKGIYRVTRQKTKKEK